MRVNPPIPIKAGETTAFSFKLPRQRISAGQLPHLRGATISPRPLGRLQAVSRRCGQLAIIAIYFNAPGPYGSRLGVSTDI